jgi:hypothetical protein
LIEEMQMAWYFYLGWFFAGVFLANAIPHIVQGICGNRFQSPFAKPPGIGESSAIVNVIWGFANLAIGGALLHICFPAELPPPWGLGIAALIGAAASALWLAHHFGKVRNAAPHP